MGAGPSSPPVWNAGLPDPDRARHGGSHRALEVGHALGRHQAADVVGAGPLQGLHGHADVVGGHQRVPVEPDDDLVAGGRERQVEARAGGPGRVVDQPDPVVGRGQPARDLVGAVPGRPQREDHLERAGVVLRRARSPLPTAGAPPRRAPASPRRLRAGPAAPDVTGSSLTAPDTGGHATGALRRACPAAAPARPSLPFPVPSRVAAPAAAPEPAAAVEAVRPAVCGRSGTSWRTRHAVAAQGCAGPLRCRLGTGAARRRVGLRAGLVVGGLDRAGRRVPRADRPARWQRRRDDDVPPGGLRRAYRHVEGRHASPARRHRTPPPPDGARTPCC